MIFGNLSPIISVHYAKPQIHRRTMKNLIIRLALIAMLVSLMPSANIAHAEGGNSVDTFIANSNSVESAAATSAYFYVSPTGSSSGNGSLARPWDLQTALNQPSAVKPGTVIYLLKGTYKGRFTNRLRGSSTGWIIVRNVPNHRVILSDASGPILDIADSQYVIFLGLEISSSYSKRTTSRSESTYGIRIRQGDDSHHLKFINMIVHDVQAQGIGWWQALKDTEIYGSLFYYNGVTQLDHGVYAHNVSGTKRFANNMVYDNASHGFHGYAETSEKGLNNLYLDSNTFFNNGSIGLITTTGKYGTYKRNILVGGLTKTQNATIVNNLTYYPGKEGSSLNLGYDAGSSNSRVINNYFAGGIFKIGGSTSGLSMSGNVIYAPGGASGFTKSNYPNNLVMTSKPQDIRVYIRPNTYDRSRAHVTIYNWAKSATIWIPATSLGGIKLTPGRQYELRNAQDYFGDVYTGVYDGKGISVKMTGRTVAQPMGLSFKPPSTFPEFGAFVLIGK